MPKKILVTGGSGLLGSALKEVVNDKDEWFFVSSQDANLMKKKQVQLLFERIKPTHVIHLAAEVGGLFKNMNNNLQMYKNNMKMNENVLDCCYLYQVEKCLSCLSTCIFPDKTEYPITEDMLHDGPPHDSNFGYSYAKRNLEILSRCYNEKSSKTLFFCIIPCNIYGPNDNYNLQTAHVIPALIHKAEIAASEHKPLIILGSGKPLRQFIYSYDVARLIKKLIMDYNSTSPIILSVDPEEEISIGEVGKLIVESFPAEKKPTSIKFDDSFSDGQYKKTASNKKLRNLYPDYKFVLMKESIKESVEWFIKNKDKSRI